MQKKFFTEHPERGSNSRSLDCFYLKGKLEVKRDIHFTIGTNVNSAANLTESLFELEGHFTL